MTGTGTSPAADRRRAARGAWKLLPLLPVFCLMAAGVVHTVGESLVVYPGERVPGAYRRMAELPDFGRSIAFSLFVAAVSASVSVTAGTALSHLLWRLPGRWRTWGILFSFPLILPHLAVGFLAIVWLGQTGILGSIVERIGYPGLYRSPLFRGDGVGIMIAYVYKSTPFALVLILPILRSIPETHLMTARMLGAGEARGFFRVILPRLLPAIGSAWIILFVYAFGAYDLPFVIGESSPRMISLYLYRLYFARPLGERPIAAAVLTLVFLIGIAMVTLYARAVSGLEQRERRL